ncbi:MAG: GNAT family N-acetyltransferase [Pyrinomonadaceae bacterium]|nr:GNAT family N-acetyltransferase [Pyrinomonadaceae bacterium]
MRSTRCFANRARSNLSKNNSVNILETEHLILRELDSAVDAEFIFALLNTPKFIQYIGDRGVRSVNEAAAFIDGRFVKSYRYHGYGLYAVVRKDDKKQAGICGFVKRDHFEFPDIGFAFLPEYERLGYGFESAEAMMVYGRETLGFATVLAITTPDNDASGRLLEKLGFAFTGLIDSPENEKLRLFTSDPLIVSENSSE